MKNSFNKREVIGAGLGVLLALATPFAATADAPGPQITRSATNTWAVMAGSSLKGTLERWAEIAGWTLIWDHRSDFQLRASATFKGSFQVAVGSLIDGIYLSNPGFSATLYRGNQVLHIQEQILSSQ